MYLFENRIHTFSSPAYQHSKTSSGFFEVRLVESSPSKAIELFKYFLKSDYSTQKWRATGLPRVIPSTFLAWFTGTPVPVLPSGLINRALFWVREMREDHFLNQRNSGNMDKEAKEIKAGQVVQSRAGMTWHEPGVPRPNLSVICKWGGNPALSLDSLLTQPLCIALRQEELGTQSLFWFLSYCSFAPVFPSAR